MKRRFWFIPLIPVGIAAFVAAAVSAVYWLWNLLIPSLFHGPSLLWWQAAALLALARLLFGAFGAHGGGRGWGRHRHGACHDHGRHGCHREGPSMKEWWETKGRADFEAWKASQETETPKS